MVVGFAAVAALVSGAVVAVGVPWTDVYGVPLADENHVAALGVVGAFACGLAAMLWLSYKMHLRYGERR